MNFFVPAKDNVKLAALLKAINADAELMQLWKCANVNAVSRCGISDHGEIHIQIIANAALKLMRLLVAGGIEPSVVEHHKLTAHDAEIIVVLAACLHDVGIVIHRHDHEKYSPIIAYPKCRQLLEGIYDEPDRTTIVSEVLHAIVSHNATEQCLTIEAGVLKVADALDMSKGRSRIPFEAGGVNIHSVSAQAVEDVSITKGETRPVQIDITLTNSAGIFQVDELLRKKLKNSTLAPYVEVAARLKEGEGERRILEMVRL